MKNLNDSYETVRSNLTQQLHQATFKGEKQHEHQVRRILSSYVLNTRFEQDHLAAQRFNSWTGSFVSPRLEFETILYFSRIVPLFCHASHCNEQ